MVVKSHSHKSDEALPIHTMQSALRIRGMHYANLACRMAVWPRGVGLVFTRMQPRLGRTRKFSALASQLALEPSVCPNTHELLEINDEDHPGMERGQLGVNCSICHCQCAPGQLHIVDSNMQLVCSRCLKYIGHMPFSSLLGDVPNGPP